MKENSGINMTNVKKEFNLEKLPTLHDVLCVEEAIQDSNESIVSIPELKKSLHGKMNQETLTVILDYLDQQNKIARSSKGVTWIKNTKKLLDFFDELLKNSDLTEEDCIRLGRKFNRNVAKRFYAEEAEDGKKQSSKKKNIEKLAAESKLTKEDVEVFSKKINSSATKKFLSERKP